MNKFAHANTTIGWIAGCIYAIWFAPLATPIGWVGAALLIVVGACVPATIIGLAVALLAGLLTKAFTKHAFGSKVLYAASVFFGPVFGFFAAILTVGFFYDQ